MFSLHLSSLVCIISVSYLLHSVHGVPIKDAIDGELTTKQYQKECRDICKEIGCLGFYCGDECLCECYDGQLDMEKLKKVAARDLKYIILIQGPDGTHMLNETIYKHDSVPQRTENVDVVYSDNNNLRQKRDSPFVASPNELVASVREVIVPLKAGAIAGAAAAKKILLVKDGLKIAGVLTGLKAKAAALKKKAVIAPIAIKKLSFDKFAIGGRGGSEGGFKGIAGLGAPTPDVAAPAPVVAAPAPDPVVAAPAPAPAPNPSKT